MVGTCFAHTHRTTFLLYVVLRNGQLLGYSSRCPFDDKTDEHGSFICLL